MKMYRQGDVLIVAVDEPNLTKIAHRLDHLIVERGEVTGHAHRFENDGVALFGQGGQMYIKADRPSDLLHQEHATITIPEGTYKVIRQREFQGEESRYVRD